jgi:hypothetical protein
MTSLVNDMMRIVPKKWMLVVKVTPIVVVLALVKVAVHLLEGDFIELSTLLGSMIAASVFLLGFLLAATLADYKESERLPGELASSLESIVDECEITLKNKGGPEAQGAMEYAAGLVSAIHRWFYRKERTQAVLERIHGLNDIFLTFESLTQPNFIVRMKQEQANVRRMVMRIDTVRDTSFVSAAYTIAEMAVALCLAGLIFADIQPLYESLFYVVAMGFFLIYLIFLIRDLDDPFSFSEDEVEAADVSIKPIADLDRKLAASNEGLQVGEAAAR